LGSGTGNGYGPGYGGGAGGGLYRVGGGVSAPVPLNSVEAEFSDEARRAKYQGVCLISLIVDAQGNPQNPRVIRALGMGLDEKALEAVRKYKFKPAMKDGKTPVPVMITVEVNFRLY
jgi:TonB family protein